MLEFNELEKKKYLKKNLYKFKTSVISDNYFEFQRFKLKQTNFIILVTRKSGKRTGGG